ncbi:MAG: DUF2079 domain-containing protein [Lachnospiraceae bacterium]|nr:DUF2079 domain-containing protein [Lachnospiraceae bacterium]
MSKLIRHLFTAWLFAITVEYFILPKELRNLTNLTGLNQMSIIRVIIITLIAACILTATNHFFTNSDIVLKWLPTCIFSALTIAVLKSSFSWTLLMTCSLIIVILVMYGLYGWDNSPLSVANANPTTTNKTYLCITFGMSIAFFLFVSAWTVFRVYTFSTPTYDFGIFAQMFYSMKETGLPMTTLERDGLLSHFQVHVSPVYYLFLPFYMLVPVPATLQVLQAAVITSAVIPLWKLARLHNLSPAKSMIICALLLLYPAFSGGTGYDIHENCFLTPLVLWLFYGIDRKNTVITAIAAILTLMVKEDAAVYVAVIALWLIIKTLLHFKKPELKHLITGIIMLGVSILWFLLATGYLAKFGDGVMTNRYENFMYDGSSSLITVIKSVILCPMKATYECVDIEKIEYIILTMLPLMGLPLLTRRYERYILLIPYILVNLMSDYPYQHDIFFQYGFGSTACLIYLTVVNLANLMSNWRRSMLIPAVIISLVCFLTLIVPKAIRYPKNYIKYHDHYKSIQEALKTIPDEAAVTATTFYTSCLSQREVIYDLGYATREHVLETEYVVVNLSADLKKYADNGNNNGLERLIEFLEGNEYETVNEFEGVLVIYKKQ